MRKVQCFKYFNKMWKLQFEYRHADDQTMGHLALTDEQDRLNLHSDSCQMQ